MYLKRLEIQGFKSFAHKTVLEFEPGITAVVGPNGSGKSNVADSLRWVMGEQSLKILRGKKSEDVIFAGSDKKSKLSFAEVALTFDNKDRKMPVEYSEVVVSRRLYRNGDSEYLINNNRSRLLDVVDLLLRCGFGATNYSVIGQGLIDQMILGGPAEIKNLVEEASGVKPYYLKREKTIRKLEQTSENLLRVSELVKEIEPRLRSLRRQAKRMEEREVIAAQLASLQMEYYGNQTYLLETDLTAVVDRLELRRQAVEKLDLEISSFEKTLEKEEQQTDRSNSFLDELEKKAKILDEKKLLLLEKLAEIKGKMRAEVPITRNFNEFRTKFEDIIATLTPENVEDVKAKLKALVLSYSESKNDDLLGQKKALDTELETTVKEIAEYNATKAKLLAEEKQKKSFLTEEEKKFRAKTSELTKLKDEMNTVLVEKAKLDTRLESLDREIKEAFGHIPETLKQHKKAELPADLPNQMSRLKHQLELAGGVDEATMMEYRETEERFNYLTNQSQDLDRAVKDLKNVIEELDQIIKKQFDEAFGKISKKFEEYFRILFNGGLAQMSLLKATANGEEELMEEEENSEPIFDGVKKKKGSTQIVGIEIRATPPGKKLATIAALSGGERALTAIALLCSMLATYPSPFVVLDEVDAALDEANSIRFASILGTLAHQTQFVAITHNRETMRQAHTLYGVTMTDEGISKILSIKIDKAEAIAQ